MFKTLTLLSRQYLYTLSLKLALLMVLLLGLALLTVFTASALITVGHVNILLALGLCLLPWLIALIVLAVCLMTVAKRFKKRKEVASLFDGLQLGSQLFSLVALWFINKKRN